MKRQSISLARVAAAALGAAVVAMAIPMRADRLPSIGVAAPAPPSDDAAILHVLNRIGFGPRPGDLERVRKMGIEAYLDEQLHPERIPDSALRARLASMPTLTMNSRDLAAGYFMPALEVKKDVQQDKKAAAKASPPPDMTASAPATAVAKPKAQASPAARQAQANARTPLDEMMDARVLRATLSDRQLEEVLDDFWFNHFNIYIGKKNAREFLPEYERDAIRPYVLGKFRDLLGATAHSPAMLTYLDNWESADPNAAKRAADARAAAAARRTALARPNAKRPPPVTNTAAAQAKKNQPKGLNENYGRELMELHTLGVDGGYTQQDVIDVARVFTGWTIDRPNAGGTFVFKPEMHDPADKVVLGVHISGGGKDEGERVLDLLASHPSTAYHIAFELAQRFVSDTPPAALVDRAAKRFLDTKGDLRAVTRVIITSPEFFAADALRVKVKSPFEFVVSAARATGATVADPAPMIAAMKELGEPLYGCIPPTGYANTSDAWLSTGGLVARMNFALQLVGGGQATAPSRQGKPGAPQKAAAAGRAGRGSITRIENALAPDLTTMAPDVSEATRSALIARLFAGAVSDATRQTIAKATTVQQLLALTLGSPEFQQR